MTKLSKTPADKKIDFLAAYQSLGGTVGLIFMGYLFFNTDESIEYYLLAVVPGVLFYLFSFMAGLFLFQRKTYALKLSLINQLLQVFGFSFFGYGVEYVAGISFDIFIRYTDGLEITPSLGLSNWHFLFNNDTGIRELSINIVAAFLVFYILKLRKEYTTKRLTDEISTIGV